MGSFGNRLKHAWNAFTNEDKNFRLSEPVGPSYGFRPDRTFFRGSNEQSIVTSIYTRIGIDVAAVNMYHARMDENRRFNDVIDSGLNKCLTLEANVDQGARAFRQDIAMSLFDKGVVAIVPIDTTINPENSGGYDIKTMRVGDVVAWYPNHVRVRLYNQATGRREELTLAKSYVAIIENPLYSVMNEPSSTLQRLIRKLNMLDAIDEQSSSGKLDLIIQLPYVIKSEARKAQAEQRRKDIEVQLKGSQYGIAYTDGTERITQLNRPAENNLLTQIQYLTDMLYSQLGITAEVLDGTAKEETMLNYYNRTVEPILGAIAEAMKRTFLTSTARTQLQSIHYIRDPFKLVPVGNLAALADKFTRNEILSSNEFRSLIGFGPSKDPNANKLLNKNIPAPPGSGIGTAAHPVQKPITVPEGEAFKPVSQAPPPRQLKQ